MVSSSTRQAVWWRTQRGPLVGLVPRESLRAFPSPIPGSTWLVATLLPETTEPSLDSPADWSLGTLREMRQYSKADALFQRLLKAHGGPAERVNGRLPALTPHPHWLWALWASIRRRLRALLRGRRS